MGTPLPIGAAEESIRVHTVVMPCSWPRRHLNDSTP